MLSVKSILDTLWLINLIQYPIGIVLHGSSEDDNLIELSHLCEELIAARSDKEGSL